MDESEGAPKKEYTFVPADIKLAEPYPQMGHNSWGYEFMPEAPWQAVVYRFAINAVLDKAGIRGAFWQGGSHDYNNDQYWEILGESTDDEVGLQLLDLIPEIQEEAEALFNSWVETDRLEHFTHQS